VIERVRQKVAGLLDEHRAKSRVQFDHEESNECKLLEQVMGFFKEAELEQRQDVAQRLRELRGGTKG
jgi:hypothetical protein